MTDGTLTLADYLSDWLRLQRTRLQPSTWVQYEGSIRLHLGPPLGKIELTELDVAHINEAYAWLIDEGSQSGGSLSVGTVTRAHAVLHKALEDAHKQGLVNTNPSRHATVPKIDPFADAPKEIRAWNAQQLRQFLEETEGDEHHEFWTVAAGTGLRRGELLGLSWRNTDLERGSVSVRHSLSQVQGRLRLKSTKTNRVRHIVIDDHVLTTLHKRRERQESNRRTANGTWDNEWGLVFTQDDGSPHPPHRLTYEWVKAMKKIDLPRIRLHDLRHTHATLLLEAGVSLKVVSDRLGHTSISTTMDIYAHVLPAMDDEAARRFGSHVWGEPGES